jgi:hypothetical protein
VPQLPQPFGESFVAALLSSLLHPDSRCCVHVCVCIRFFRRSYTQIADVVCMCVCIRFFRRSYTQIADVVCMCVCVYTLLSSLLHPDSRCNVHVCVYRQVCCVSVGAHKAPQIPQPFGQDSDALINVGIESDSHTPTVTHRVGQNRIYTPYMTVYLVISLPKIPYIHRIYMVLANPSYTATSHSN